MRSDFVLLRVLGKNKNLAYNGTANSKQNKQFFFGQEGSELL